MRKSLLIIFVAVCFLLPGLHYESSLLAQADRTVKGIVFQDKTGNESYDPSQDKPLKGIAVSNGREVVLTNKEGIYELPLRNNSSIFVVKPRNWMVSVDENQIVLMF